MTATANQRDRLKQIRDRLGDARARRTRARAARDAAEGTGDELAIRIASDTLEEAEAVVAQDEALEKMVLGQMANVSDSNGHFGGGIFDNPEVVQTLERLGNGSFPIGRVDLGPVSSREEFVAQINTGRWGLPKLAAAGDVNVPDSARLGAYYGVVPQLRRPLSLLDIIPTSTMEGRSFGYMQEGGSLDSAAATPEGAVKPVGDLTLTEAEVVAATIAVHVPLKRQQLADTPSLAQTVNDRLVYGCLRTLETQVVAGDGTGENLLGILATPGIGSVVFDAAAALSDLTIDGIVATIDADAVPDAVVLNPHDWAGMLKHKAAGSGSGSTRTGCSATRPRQLGDCQPC